MHQHAVAKLVEHEAYLVLSAPGGSAQSFASNVLITAKNVQLQEHLRNLYAHLFENHYIECIVGFDRDVLHIVPDDVARRIERHDPSWEAMVPAPAADAIKRRHLFGHADPVPATTAP